VVTIYDVAKAANVSPMTVSRVINQSPRISEKTRAKVEEAIRQLEYIPNKQARSMITQKTKLLALVIPDLTNPFFTSIARGAEDKAHQKGYQLLIGNTDENLSKESSYVDVLLSTGVDGVLVTPVGDASVSAWKKLGKRRVPVVFIDRFIDSIPADIVLGDNYQSTKLLVNHLVDRGHERIALINGPDNTSNSRERLSAYREALSLRGIPLREELIVSTQFQAEFGKDLMLTLTSLPEEKRPTAILAANNFIGVKTVCALRELQLNIPEEMAVACFDDPEPFSDYNPLLTVASQPAYELGHLAAQLLIERIEGQAPEKPRRISLPSELIVRKST
jgi:LacI family transcriptional regulator